MDLLACNSAFAKGRDAACNYRHSTSVGLKSLLEVMASEQPEAMAIAFDLGLPTCHDEADTYKADRPGTPEDFVPDLKNLHELRQASILKQLRATGQMMFWNSGTSRCGWV